MKITSDKARIQASINSIDFLVRPKLVAWV